LYPGQFEYIKNSSHLGILMLGSSLPIVGHHNIYSHMQQHYMHACMHIHTHTHKCILIILMLFYMNLHL